jgi:hypothetical protein
MGLLLEGGALFSSMEPVVMQLSGKVNVVVWTGV